MPNAKDGYTIKQIYTTYNAKKVFEGYLDHEKFVMSTDWSVVVTKMRGFKRTKDWKYDRYNLSLKQHSDICKMYFRAITKLLIQGIKIQMYYGLSSLQIRKRQTSAKHLKVNYHHLKVTGEKIYHTNAHSDGFYAKPYWNKAHCLIPFKAVYGFRLSDDNKTKLAKVMEVPGGHKRYEQIY